MKAKQRLATAALVAVFGLAGLGQAMAEANTVRIARQWGLAWMPFVLMEQNKIIEKHARDAGLGDVEVKWTTFAGGSAMNDALLSDSLDYATTGIPGFLTLWDKAKGVYPVKAVSAFGAVPFALVTRNPDVKTLADFSQKDRIALPTVKISGQAVLLQMATAKALGDENWNKLDPLTVSRSNPDGMAAVMSPGNEINSHFSSPPYLQTELTDPAIHVVLNTTDLFDTPFSNGLLYTTEAFHDKNPKLYQVVLDSLREATEAIKSDPKTAVTQYLEVTKEKSTVDETMKIIADPMVDYSLTPHNVQAVADFMHKHGTLKTKLDDWKDIFFPEVHSLQGS